MPVEYRVRPVTRHIVTRYEDGVGSTQIGEYSSAEVAHSVGHALCDAERIKAGEPLDSAAFVYPGALNDPSGCVDTAGRTRTRPKGWDEPATLTVDVRGATGNAEIRRMVSEGVAKGMQQVRAGVKSDGPS